MVAYHEPKILMKTSVLLIALAIAAPAIGEIQPNLHRSPFIIPISPATLGSVPTLQRKKLTIPASNVGLPKPDPPKPNLRKYRLPSATTFVTLKAQLPKASDYLSDSLSDSLRSLVDSERLSSALLFSVESIRDQPLRKQIEFKFKRESPTIANAGPGKADSKPAFSDSDPHSKFHSLNEPQATVHVSLNGPNLRVLAERITLHNLSIAALEERLQETDFWTLKDLKQAVEEVEALYRSQQVWSLYYGLLRPTERRHVGIPRRFSKSTELMLQRIFETNVALQVQPLAVAAVTPELAAKELNELSDRLLELRNDKP